jgi:peptidoglycan/LPS O-acetylase OafA/YrhL
VWLFFILSGFVLTKAASRPSFSWSAYYPSRMVRLYGPVLFAIVLAWVSYKIVPHVIHPGDPYYLTLLPRGYPFTDMLKDATLLGGTSNSIGVLWSLQWEVLFSLALPVYLFLVRRYPIPATALAIVACLVGWTVNDQVTSYLPMFFFGALLAQYWQPVARAFRFLAKGGWISHLTGAALTLVAICAITSFFLLGTWINTFGVPARTVTLPVVLAGIVLIIVVGTQWKPLSRLLTTRPLIFFGTISFSLYLVHRPIMVAFAFAFGFGIPSAVLATVTSLVVAVLFYYALERPMHRLSQRTATRIRATEQQKSETLEASGVKSAS